MGPVPGVLLPRVRLADGFSKPLASAYSVPRGCDAAPPGGVKYLSTIGIWSRFILGVIATR